MPQWSSVQGTYRLHNVTTDNTRTTSFSSETKIYTIAHNIHLHSTHCLPHQSDTLPSAPSLCPLPPPSNTLGPQPPQQSLGTCSQPLPLRPLHLHLQKSTSQSKHTNTPAFLSVSGALIIPSPRPRGLGANHCDRRRKPRT